MTIEEPPKVKTVTVQSQVKIIRSIAIAEIGVSLFITISQTVAIAASYAYWTRSLTGIWTSWVFFMGGGIALFWSVRCTFNGLLAVLVSQIIAATIGIPLFTANCIILGVYDFQFNPDEHGAAMVGSSITVLTTNILMIVASLAEMSLNSYNAYKCYFLAYGGQQKESNYDQRSICSSAEEEGPTVGVSGESRGLDLQLKQEIKPPPIDPNMPKPPPDLTFESTEILIIKYCGVTGVILGVIIFCSQTTMLALANNDGIRIGIGIWGALYYFLTGIVTVYSGMKQSSQSTIAIFVLQLLQLAISVPMVCIAYYIVASFGSCLQISPFNDCTYKKPYGFGGSDLTVTIMGGIMAIAGMTQGLTSLILVLICSQAVCGIRCMISGATVYPML